MKLLKAVLAIELIMGLIFLLTTRFGNIPPLGDVLNPATGFWNNAELESQSKKIVVQVHKTNKPVTVQYDLSAIPHIFGSNDYDIYFGQGYVTARDRLWQMDMQSRTAAGRMSEVQGEQGLDRDEYYARIGLLYAAEKSLALMQKDSTMKIVLDAYSDGVNAYIEELTPSRYPVEYKLMKFAPEKWTPLKSVLIFKLMAETLSSGANDFQMSSALKKFGPEMTADLYPDLPFSSEPIMPAHTNWLFSPVSLPEIPVNKLSVAAADLDIKRKPEGIGSNNWVVNGKKTKNGFPLLANDPHLGLTLPSVWYQLQMASPSVNVYGVSIPGIPCVFVGFNNHIAWGLTNSGADVRDWYRIRFRDPSKNEYWYNDKWNFVSKRVQKIVIRGQKPFYDTISYTLHGPIARKSGPWEKLDDEDNAVIAYALRWTTLEASEDITTFYLLNRALSFGDFQQALGFFCSPAQNFIFADIKNNIAIATGGKFPLRYKDQGKFLLDGGAPVEDWNGWIPSLHNPSSKNPEQGYLSSANQIPVDSCYPYYLGWEFGSSERALRINSWLSHTNKATVDSMQALQNDTYSTLSASMLPVLLATLDTTFGKPYKYALNELNNWDYHYDQGSIGATIFNLWWDILYKAIWSDKVNKRNQSLKWPSRDRTQRLLLMEGNSLWFDNSQTPQKETRRLLINESFVKAVDSLTARFGVDLVKWNWGNSRQCRIPHIGGIDAFGSGPFSAGGAANTVNALTEDFGPSWRMVVELGTPVKAYGIFPGGESGNPGSQFYDNFIRDWKGGRLQPLLFLQSEHDFADSARFTLTIK
ncbi:MAG: penicillin acylase family protein [Chitinophagaceae bacterium]